MDNIYNILNYLNKKATEQSKALNVMMNNQDIDDQVYRDETLEGETETSDDMLEDYKEDFIT